MLSTVHGQYKLRPVGPQRTGPIVDGAVRGLNRPALLELLQDLSLQLDTLPAHEGAVGVVLERLCHASDWDAGHAYLRDPDGRWAAPAGLRYTARQRPVLNEVFEGAAGGAGAWIDAVCADGGARIIALQQPQHSHRPHHCSAWRWGLRSAILLPIAAAGETFAVLECFSSASITAAGRTLNVLRAIGAQMGQIMARRALEQCITELAASEQRRFGQELHDTVAQQVSGLTIMSRTLQKRLEHTPEAARVERLVRGLEQTCAQVRAMARGLLMFEIGADGLRAAFDQLARFIRQVYEIDCRVDCQDVRLEDATAMQLFYIGREAVVNAAKHAHARSIVIHLGGRNGATVLQVRDDGNGIPSGGHDTNGSANHSSGMGLRIMRCRAELIGADLCIESTPGHGVNVTCSLAKEPQNDNDQQ